MKYEDTFAVIKNKETYSKIDGKKLNTLTMTRIADRKDYITYIQPTMRNHSGWLDIVNDPTQAHLVEIPGWTVVKKNIIDADCQPVVHASCSTVEMQSLIEDKWREEDRQKRKDQSKLTGNPVFDSLFDIE